MSRIPKCFSPSLILFPNLVKLMFVLISLWLDFKVLLSLFSLFLIDDFKSIKPTIRIVFQILFHIAHSFKKKNCPWCLSSWCVVVLTKSQFTSKSVLVRKETNSYKDTHTTSARSFEVSYIFISSNLFIQDISPLLNGRYEFQGEVAKNQMSSAVRSDLLKSLTLIVTYIYSRVNIFFSLISK